MFVLIVTPRDRMRPHNHHRWSDWPVLVCTNWTRSLFLGMYAQWHCTASSGWYNSATCITHWSWVTDSGMRHASDWYTAELMHCGRAQFKCCGTSGAPGWASEPITSHHHTAGLPVQQLTTFSARQVDFMERPIVRKNLFKFVHMDNMHPFPGLQF